jgi:hypothetical protein
MKFRTVILTTGKTAAGMVVPPEVVAGLGSSKKPAVKVTLNGYTYRSTVATMDGKFMVGVSAENRALTGVAAGDRVEVDLALDDAPRVVDIPADFAKAVAKDKDAKQFFGSLSNSRQRAAVTAIETAKKPETRARRIATTVEQLHAGQAPR